jgi:hypothetical protein
MRPLGASPRHVEFDGEKELGGVNLSPFPFNVLIDGIFAIGLIFHVVAIIVPTEDAHGIHLNAPLFGSRHFPSHSACLSL